VHDEGEGGHRGGDAIMLHSMDEFNATFEDDESDCDSNSFLGLEFSSMSFFSGVIVGSIASLCLLIVRHLIYVENEELSFNLVPIGAYFNNGSAKDGISGFLVACYDTDTQMYHGVTIVETGFALLEGQALQDIVYYLDDYIAPTKCSKYALQKSNECHVWFDPVQLWQVSADDFLLTKGSVAGRTKLGQTQRGVGLRYPKFIRVVDDFGPEAATTSDEILKRYNLLTEEEKAMCFDFDDEC